MLYDADDSIDSIALTATNQITQTLIRKKQ